MYKGASEWGHIIVGMTDKTSKLFDTVKHFMTELKWVVFDECDDIKENTEQMFSQLLKKLADNSNANVTNLVILVHCVFGNWKFNRRGFRTPTQCEVPQIHTKPHPIQKRC